MPVNLTVSIPDPPTAPAGYLLVTFEVADVSKERQPELHSFPLSTDGYERAAGDYLTRAVTGQRLVAVAWFADKPLTDCPDGHERIISQYDPLTGEWSEWVPQDRIGPPRSPHKITRPSSRDRSGPSPNGGHRDVGDSLAADVV